MMVVDKVICESNSGVNSHYQDIELQNVQFLSCQFPFSYTPSTPTSPVPYLYL